MELISYLWHMLDDTTESVAEHSSKLQPFMILSHGKAVSMESCNWIDFISGAYARWYHWGVAEHNLRLQPSINHQRCGFLSSKPVMVLLDLNWFADTFPRGRFRLIGFFLCVLSACSVGFGITDVVITALGVIVQGTNWGCLDSPNPYYNILGPGVTSMQFGMWFWFSVGIWAPLTVSYLFIYLFYYFICIK